MGGKTMVRYTSIKSHYPSTALEARDHAGLVALLDAVFGLPPEPPWPAIAVFDDDGSCAAALQHAALLLACEDGTLPVLALRNVCVAPARRGGGLMRRLMELALARSDADRVPTLLYAEEPALYARFGFAPVAQHAFEGPAPAPEGGAAIVDCLDETLLRRLVETRTPVSRRCDLVGDGGLRLARLRRPAEAERHYLETLDALVVIEREGDTLVLVDIVAPRMPSAAAVLGALGERPRRLRTLFSPDRLGWGGGSVAEDTGLMVRGRLPDALSDRPFMLPPTVEF